MRISKVRQVGGWGRSGKWYLIKGDNSINVVGINSRGTTLAKVCKIEHVNLHVIGKGTNRIS